jgi:hypothetical protein
MRHKIMDQPTSRQSQIAMNAAKASNNKDPSNKEQMQSEETTKTDENKKKKAEDQLIIHYTHEKRFTSTKREMHEKYADVFKNTPAMNVRLIVGNRNRRAATNDLIRKKPPKSLLTNKPRKSKHPLQKNIE